MFNTPVSVAAGPAGTTGRYDVPVGYYTTVHGLGVEPRDVSFEGSAGVHQAEPGRNLIQFWRGAENLRNAPASGKMVWSVRSTPHQY